MRVICIGHQDFANFSYYKSESLKSVGVDCDSYVLKPHPFAYPNQAIRSNIEQIKKEIAKADLIHVMHSCGTMWDLVKETGKRIIVWHTGTRYRSEPEKHNARWNPIVERSMFALGEFENLGCKDGEYFTMTVNTDELQLNHCNDTQLVFGHYPSNPQVKGTQNIMRVLSDLNVKYRNKFQQRISVKRCGYEQQLKRIANCHAYIEMSNTMQKTTHGDKPYGSWGTTALEASALGKIVVTNSLWDKCYHKYYGEHKLLVANNKVELKNQLEYLLSLSREEIVRMGEEARQWVVDMHGYKATGERLIKYL